MINKLPRITCGAPRGYVRVKAATHGQILSAVNVDRSVAASVFSHPVHCRRVAYELTQQTYMEVQNHYSAAKIRPCHAYVALAQHTSSTSTRRLQTSLVGHTSVLLNAATCWFFAPELSSADGVFQLLHRPSGTLFRHTCARH